MRKPHSASALYLTGHAGSTWSIRTADGAIFEVQFANASSPVIVPHGSGVNPDRRPRRLAAFESEIGEPLRFTVTDHREAFRAVVETIERTRSFCLRCGERLMLSLCVRCVINSGHLNTTNYDGKRLPRRRRFVHWIDPLLRFIEGR